MTGGLDDPCDLLSGVDVRQGPDLWAMEQIRRRDFMDRVFGVEKPSQVSDDPESNVPGIR